MNAQDRETVKLLIDHAKRERLERANRPAPAPVLATVHYLPTHNIEPVATSVAVVEPEPVAGRCMFCGGRTRSDVCRAHEDLVA